MVWRITIDSRTAQEMEVLQHSPRWVCVSVTWRVVWVVVRLVVHLAIWWAVRRVPGRTVRTGCRLSGRSVVGRVFLGDAMGYEHSVE